MNMNCKDVTPSLKGLAVRTANFILTQERNKFTKSRQQWIQAAFDLERGDNTLFKRLVVEELCDNCIISYSKKHN